MKKPYPYLETYRRRVLNILQIKYEYLYTGVVLDIGGRDRGHFSKPKEKVDKWIFADINEEHNPDIVIDVAHMDQIESNSIEVVNAIELFEHVQEVELGLKECYRVLKKDGVLILSSPLVFPIHADPYDYQRWTYIKWQLELEKVGFSVKKIIVTGKFYTNLADMLKFKLRPKNRLTLFRKILIRCLNPILDLLVRFDGRDSIKDKPMLNNFHNGYFIIAKK